jgi:hypothetical protein
MLFRQILWPASFFPFRYVLSADGNSPRRWTFPERRTPPPETLVLDGEDHSLMLLVSLLVPSRTME